jgi:hypothetical protein
MKKNGLEERVFELISYMAISARNLLDEPSQYGPFRLVDATSRLAEILNQMDLGSERLEKIRTYIEAGKTSVMVSEEEFTKFLDGLVSLLVEEIEGMP